MRKIKQETAEKISILFSALLLLVTFGVGIASAENWPMQKTRYENPLTTRYVSREMQAIFSPDRKFTLWRKLWVALGTLSFTP